MAKKSDIRVSVTLDDNNVPHEIEWAADEGIDGIQKSKAMMLSFWDHNSQNAMRMDLWTQDMSIDDMKKFFHQTLLTMADTFQRATGEENITEDLRDYCWHFAKKMDLIPDEEGPRPDQPQ